MPCSGDTNGSRETSEASPDNTDIDHWFWHRLNPLMAADIGGKDTATATIER